MKLKLVAVMAAIALSTPALAQGDIEAGEKVFKKCKSCHMIQDAAGETIVKGGKTGPNLYGVIGRTAGAFDGYTKYSKSMIAAGEAGLVWDQEQFQAYVQDPSGFLKTYLDDSKAKSKMSLKLKKGLEDVYAYLVSVAEESS